jgi:hypothetical protein
LQIYYSNFLNGKRDGEGTIFYEDGTTFTGNFANDFRHGKGVWILKDGRKRSVVYESGVRKWSVENGDKKMIKLFSDWVLIFFVLLTFLR